MADEMVSLPLFRLHSMIAGSFRYGAECERLKTLGGTEMVYGLSEHHARKLVDEFTEAGHVTTAPPEDPNE